MRIFILYRRVVKNFRIIILPDKMTLIIKKFRNCIVYYKFIRKIIN